MIGHLWDLSKERPGWTSSWQQTQQIYLLPCLQLSCWKRTPTNIWQCNQLKSYWKKIRNKKILSNLLHGSHPLLFLCRKMDCHPSLTCNSFEVFLVSKIAGFSKEYFSHQHHQQQDPQTASLPRAPQGPAINPWTTMNNEESLKKCLLIGNHTCKLLYQRGGWQENLLHWSVRVWVGLGSVQEEAVDCPTNPTDSVWWCWCKDFFVTCVLFGVYTRVRNINQSQKGNLSDGWLGLWWVSFWKYVFVWHFLKS